MYAYVIENIEGLEMHKVIYYEKPSGRRPVLDFINGLEMKAQAVILEHFDALRIQGHNLHRPDADVVKGRIRELRTRFLNNRFRTLYYFYHKDYIILLHAFQKKTGKIDSREIETAEKRMKDFESRLANGGIKL
jgi:phage-related protein